MLLDISIPEWKSEAACKGLPPELFVPPIEEADWLEAEAVNRLGPICESCPVNTACFESAFEAGDPGIWAGTTTQQRDALRACHPDTRTRLQALKEADALELADARFAEQGPDPEDTKHLVTAAEYQNIWGRVPEVGGCKPHVKVRNYSTSAIVADCLSDGKAVDRNELIKEVAARLEELTAPVKSYWHSARSAVVRGERSGTLISSVSDTGKRTVQLRDAT